MCPFIINNYQFNILHNIQGNQHNSYNFCYNLNNPNYLKYIILINIIDSNINFYRVNNQSHIRHIFHVYCIIYKIKCHNKYKINHHIFNKTLHHNHLYNFHFINNQDFSILYMKVRHYMFHTLANKFNIHYCY